VEENLDENPRNARFLKTRVVSSSLQVLVWGYLVIREWRQHPGGMISYAFLLSISINLVILWIDVTGLYKKRSLIRD